MHQSRETVEKERKGKRAIFQSLVLVLIASHQVSPYSKQHLLRQLGHLCRRADRLDRVDRPQCIQNGTHALDAIGYFATNHTGCLEQPKRQVRQSFRDRIALNDVTRPLLPIHVQNFIARLVGAACDR